MPARTPQQSHPVSGIARVAVPSPLRRLFDYLIPANTHVQPGIRVRVPFGSRELTGIIVAIVDQSDIETSQLRPITEVLDHDELIPSHLLDLWLWAANYYQHPVGDALHSLLPAGLRKKSAASIRSHHSDPSQPEITPTDTDIPTPNNQQDEAIRAVNDSSGQFNSFLLDGVTGSGKTEVYLQCIDHILKQDKQAVMLVPEISLTPQTIERFRQRFSAAIAILHSGLTPRQRLNAWLEAASGVARIIIGTRSALFTPMAQPGLIIIDEEHDASFKQQDGFRYSARDLAVLRARHESIPVILGSATPSLESLYNANTGRYRHIQLTQRAGTASMPTFQLVDTRRQLSEPGLSSDLLLATARHLKQGGQVLIFINRRGFAPVLHCEDCGWTSECPSCDARLTVHRKPPHLCCHHCETRQPVPDHCPDCQGKSLGTGGTGTEQCESALATAFPDTPVLRLDRDATRRKGELERILKQINNGEPCILVGTQMIAKGHHLPGVTLVGVLDADNGLFSADFRGQEFMAQMLIQVAGRAGRASQPGEVLIQTSNPEHQSLQTLIHDGYHALARTLLNEREAAAMPPYGYLVIIRAEAVSMAAPQRYLTLARQVINSQIHSQQLNDIEVHGPLPAPMERRANRYRQHLILKSSSRSVLQSLLTPVCQILEGRSESRRVRWSVDVDPLDML
ncbi:primosomal protein N' [Pseudohongiella nitratireducens]|uniref:primosomal protein N' n=1 Tax=Pseudohongiella nitratireducens TaxID=1768907 RepID=UPI0030EC9A39